MKLFLSIIFLLLVSISLQSAFGDNEINSNRNMTAVIVHDSTTIHLGYVIKIIGTEIAELAEWHIFSPNAILLNTIHHTSLSNDNTTALFIFPKDWEQGIYTFTIIDALGSMNTTHNYVK